MSEKAPASALHRPTAKPAAARSRRGWLVLCGIALMLVAGWLAWPRTPATPWLQGFRVVASFPHDPAAYCQGLVFDDGVLHESTGLRGQSSVRTVELESGKPLRKTDLAPPLFGEGLALVGERLIQITWEEHVAFLYDRKTLERVGQFEYTGEGWGLAFDGRELVMSDGSEFLVFRDPKTFQETRRLRVLAKGLPLRNLNELEFVEGEVWANVWGKDFLARIDPATGIVRGIIDLSGIFDRRAIPHQDAVLNGIAYDSKSKRLFVTGKLWPKLFEIEIVAK